MNRRLAIAVLLPALVLGATGCAPYRVGTASLYPADVATVHVPIFESDSFRRNLGERLTEAVCKRIEDETPYKVVRSGVADSVLSGRIIHDRKRVLVENRNDDVREVETSLYVQVTWAKRDGTLIAQNVMIPIDPGLTVDVLGLSPVVPETGQSIATGHQQAIERLSAQIVGMMEAPW
ncbi:MAG: LPS assembly lipoprotein LptE [Pirellulales bacterium]